MSRRRLVAIRVQLELPPGAIRAHAVAYVEAAIKNSIGLAKGPMQSLDLELVRVAPIPPRPRGYERYANHLEGITGAD